jgi:hypothetical protein
VVKLSGRQRTLLGPVLGRLPPFQAAFLTSRGFFPALISPVFAHGLACIPPLTIA